MNSTAAKPKPIRRAVGAVLIPAERLDEWYTRASATPGLNDVERKVLDAIREWHRELYVEQFEGSLSHVRMARRLDVDPVHVRWAVDHLVELGLVAVKPAPARGQTRTCCACRSASPSRCRP